MSVPNPRQTREALPNERSGGGNTVFSWILGFCKRVRLWGDRNGENTEPFLCPERRGDEARRCTGLALRAVSGASRDGRWVCDSSEGMHGGQPGLSGGTLSWYELCDCRLNRHLATDKSVLSRSRDGCPKAWSLCERKLPQSSPSSAPETHESGGVLHLGMVLGTAKGHTDKTSDT